MNADQRLSNYGFEHLPQEPLYQHSRGRLGKVIVIWDITYVLQALFYVSPPFLQPGYFATTR